MHVILIIIYSSFKYIIMSAFQCQWDVVNLYTRLCERAQKVLAEKERLSSVDLNRMGLKKKLTEQGERDGKTEETRIPRHRDGGEMMSDLGDNRQQSIISVYRVTFSL